MNSPAVEDQLLQYLKRAAGQRSAAVDRQTPLISGGVLDSFAVVDLVDFVESTFTIRLTPDEMSAETLDTVERIGQLIASKRTNRHP
jgi:acyl carrier protein